MPFVARDPFILQLWALDFVFVVETRLAHVFKRGYFKIIVPKNEHLDEEWVRAELRRCAVEDQLIEDVLRAA